MPIAQMIFLNSRKTEFQEEMGTLGKISVTLAEVDIAKVLLCGQSFRWRKVEDEFVGVFGGRVWALQQTPTHLQYRILGGSDDKDISSDLEAALSQYFQLHISLPDLYTQWGQKDSRFKEISQEFQGIRILSQEPVETIFSFICSSNNHISRIGGMVEKLCSLYGTPITMTPPGSRSYHNFPTLEALAVPGVEATLRQEAFGYRAGYIASSAQKIIELGGNEWVQGLKGMTYNEARTRLQTLPGIGRKVADCICLMSLDFSQTVPVDTHMHQVAKTYLPHLAKVKTLTDKAYTEITEHFQSLYGQYSGWAHSVLFASRLKHLQQAKWKTSSTENVEEPKENKTNLKKKVSPTQKIESVAADQATSRREDESLNHRRSKRMKDK